MIWQQLSRNRKWNSEKKWAATSDRGGLDNAAIWPFVIAIYSVARAQ
jgi:hypothetical protein